MCWELAFVTSCVYLCAYEPMIRFMGKLRGRVVSHKNSSLKRHLKARRGRESETARPSVARPRRSTTTWTMLETRHPREPSARPRERTDRARTASARSSKSLERAPCRLWRLGLWPLPACEVCAVCVWRELARRLALLSLGTRRDTRVTRERGVLTNYSLHSGWCLDTVDCGRRHAPPATSDLASGGRDGLGRDGLGHLGLRGVAASHRHGRDRRCEQREATAHYGGEHRGRGGRCRPAMMEAGGGERERERTEPNTKRHT